MFQGLKIAAVIPAYNEAACIASVVTDLLSLGRSGCEIPSAHQPLLERVVVCDNGSSDETAAVAQEAGARVVCEPQKGYGYACLRGQQACRDCDVIVFVDGDGSVKATDLYLLLEQLSQGADLVIGNRLSQLCEAGALHAHQRLGTRLYAMLISQIWQVKCEDLGPLRAIRNRVFEQLGMQEMTWGWTAEMQAKAYASGYQVVEVPVSTRCRIGVSKVSGTWRGTLGAALGIGQAIARVALGQRALQSRQKPENPSI